MEFSLKMQAKRIQNIVKYEWLPSILANKNGSPTSALKPKQKWNRLDNESSKANAKALCFIFNKISPNKIHRIAICKYVKEAQDIFTVTHENIIIVKLSKLQMLTK